MTICWTAREFRKQLRNQERDKRTPSRSKSQASSSVVSILPLKYNRAVAISPSISALLDN